MNYKTSPASASLVALSILQLIMLGSLFAGVAPHPPVATPLFAIGPFLAASLAAALGAMCLGAHNSPAGTVLSGLAALMALVSFGPQKYFDPQFALIWPAVIAGQIAAVTIFVTVLKTRTRRASEKPRDRSEGAVE